MRAAVVILAGGEGRRIGGGKPLRRLAGQSLLDRALALAEHWSDDLAVAVRDPAQVGAIDVPILVDQMRQGPISGLAQALDFAAERGAEAVLTITCDTPLLPPDLLDRLTASLNENVAMPVSGDRLHPACSLWRTSVRRLLPAYLDSNRSSLRGFAETAGHSEVEWDSAPYDPFLNVNSEEDLATAERLLRSR